MSQVVSPASKKWGQFVARQNVSGLSVAQFCRLKGIPESTFFAWRRRLRLAATPGNTFVEAKITESRSADAAHPADALACFIEVRLRHGQSVRVRRGFDRDLLVDVVRVLEAME